MWSFGCVVYVMLGGYPPFLGQTEEEVIKAILNCTYDFPSPEWNHVGV
jgi:serine/threonine protein kinase